MNLVPYIAGSYAIAILVPIAFAVAAYLRLGSARRRLAAIDPRAHRTATGPRPQRRQA